MIFTVLTCASLSVIDGDNVRCNGVNMRLLGDGAPNLIGIDAPEYKGRADCERERQLGIAAAEYLEALISTPGVEVWDSGVRDRYDRPLVTVRLRDGTSAGQRMVEAGLAAIWRPGYQSQWCAD